MDVKITGSTGLVASGRVSAYFAQAPADGLRVLVIFPHHGIWPKIHETAFVAPSADLIGEVEIGMQSSIWFQSVIRGDVQSIRIGERTNIQDHSHSSRHSPK